MFKKLKSLFAFLTTLSPTMDKDCFTDAAKAMFLFPVVGAFIGLLAGLFDWVISLFLPSLVAGALALSLLLLITGLHHTDGLLDFGDGVMAHGSAERKIEIMHDQLTGAGGLSLGIMTFLTTTFAIAELPRGIIIQGLIVAEIAAKLAMVIGASTGKAARKGMASPFIEEMHGKKGMVRLLMALAISFAIALPLLRLAGALTLLSAIAASFVMVGIAHRHFKGVTGDVLGAMNELVRMVSLITLLAVIR
ncbi:MAG: adenosylcobinamide-GDP ribazoletransferase [Candidatus Bathyarchaeia archaeon]